jgi:hypothetical protein
MKDRYVIDAEAMELSVEDVRELARWLLDRPKQGWIRLPEDAAHWRGRASYRAIEEGLRWTAGMLAHDPSEESFEILLEAARWHDDLIDFMDADAHELTLASLTKSMDPADPEVGRAVQSKYAAVREVLAYALDPSADAARAHLLCLAADAHTRVRKNARKNLRDHGAEIPWWMGLLPEDPLVGMDASAAQAITEPLATLATVLDDGSGHTRETRSETITQAIERLPDRIVVALFPRLVHGEWDHRLLGSLVMETLGREGGAGVVYRAFTGNDNDEDRAYFALYERVDEVAALPAPRKAEIAAVMGKLPGDDRTPVESVLFDMAIRCATPDELFPLVEAAVARQWIFTSSILRDPPEPGTRLADTLAQALRDGFPEPWAHDAHSFRAWLSKGPRPWVRELAEIAIQSDHAGTRRWALDLLTDAVWDEERDGPLRERALALATDPRYAADFLDVWTLTMRVLGFFRSRLRSGGATIEQAIATMVAIRTFAEEDMARYARWVDASDLVAATEQEWLELRKARKAACASNPAEARSHSYYLQVREPGNPEDDALLASWIADLKDGKEAGRAMAVLIGSTEGTREMEMIRGVFERFGDNDQVKAGWDYYEIVAEKAGSRSRA